MDPTASLMMSTESRVQQASYMRTDAYMALGTSVFAILVLGLHATGRSRAAYGLAMVGTAATGVASFARLLGAANRLERSAYPGAR